LKSKNLMRAGLAMLVGLSLNMSAPAQDYVMTLSDKRVDGKIIEENDDSITIQTEYGDLRFRKINLKQIYREGQASSSSSSGDSGFNPFQNAAAFQPNDSVEIDFGSLSSDSGGEELGERPQVTLPRVDFTENAVLFGLGETDNVRIRIARNANLTNRTGPENINLREGGVVETLDQAARVVLKNGSDSIRIGPRTAVLIDKSQTDDVRLQSSTGTVWVDLDQLLIGRQFTHKLNNVVITSNGGVFRVADGLEKGVHLAVVEGEVVVNPTNSQISLTVPEGEMLFVRPDGSITEPAPIRRVILEEDVKWDTLAADWWFQPERLELGTSADETTEIISLNELQGRLGDVSNAFLNFAADTKHIPSNEEAFSVLRQNTGGWANWNGPYYDGPLPPLDSWGRPLRYTTQNTGNSGREIGVVYSFGEDYNDNGGDASSDIVQLILFYQVAQGN